VHDHIYHGVTVARLYRIENSCELIKADEKPFADEVSEMEPFVKKNARILGDVFIFGEQTISSGRDKRTDLLGVNKDGGVLVIELKKDPIDKDILPQVLSYKLYWKKHPDSVRSLWAECKTKPSEIEPDWDNYDPKVVVVAPSTSEELIDIVTEENLGIEFVELTRYQHGNTIFAVVNDIERVRTKVAPVSTRREYDWDWYAEVKDEEQVKIAKHLHEEILKFCQSRNWNVTPKFNKWYLAFKYGNRNAFLIEFRHKGRAAIGINLRDEDRDPSAKSNVKWEWDKTWEYWYVEVDSTAFDLSSISSILESAYQDTIRS